jgi:hypothetical protein
MWICEGSAAGDALNTGSHTHSTDFVRVKIIQYALKYQRMYLLIVHGKKANTVTVGACH